MKNLFTGIKRIKIINSFSYSYLGLQVDYVDCSGVE